MTDDEATELRKLLERRDRLKQRLEIIASSEPEKIGFRRNGLSIDSEESAILRDMLLRGRDMYAAATQRVIDEMSFSTAAVPKEASDDPGPRRINLP